MGFRRSSSIREYEWELERRSQMDREGIGFVAADARETVRPGNPGGCSPSIVGVAGGCLHRSAVLRQRWLRGFIGLLLRLVAPPIEADLPGVVRHARRSEGGGIGRNTLSSRGTRSGGAFLHRRYDPRASETGRAGTPRTPHHDLLRLQTVGDQGRSGNRQYRLGDLS